MYGWLSIAFGREPVRLSGWMGKTVRVTGPVVVTIGLLESVALTVRLAVPAVVGVPLIKQLFAFNPAGSVPLVMVHV